MMSNKRFPFELVELSFHDGKRKSAFIDEVEKALIEDLQSETKFGCKIMDSHTHAGSKVHIKHFIEGELLFHNNYYNEGFARLTAFRILKKLRAEKENRDIKHVILVGYESYSEIFLDITKRILEQECDTTVEYNYVFHDTAIRIEEEGRVAKSIIRNIQPNEKVCEGNTTVLEECKFKIANSFKCDTSYLQGAGVDDIILNDDVLLVFIVPINTTMSTMDKMILKFYDTIQLPYSQRYDVTLKSLLLSLITIGPSDEREYFTHYWRKVGNFFYPLSERFLEISNGRNQSDLKIESFAYVTSEWMYCNKEICRDGTVPWCVDCFPDKGERKEKEMLLKEKPIFDVPKGSVIPMLQLEQKKHLIPLRITEKDFLEKGRQLEKVWQISEFMSYLHIVKDQNHFQYFFDRVGFLNHSEEKIQKFLEDVREKEKEKSDCASDVLIFNYIISPRQPGNAQWVNLVCKYVFSSLEDSTQELDNVRTLYFEINKEYRSNLKAKYSDFFYSIETICKSARKAELRFHFVDETMVTGATFMRAADLIRCLISEIDSQFHSNFSVSLFHSIFLIYGRSSVDTRHFYMKLFKDSLLKETQSSALINRFYEYVHINIPSMRSYEDACILCNLLGDYHKIERFSATNQLADICKKVLDKHHGHFINNLYSEEGCWKIDDHIFQANFEERMILVVSHLLNLRLGKNNEPIFFSEHYKGKIDVASVSSVLEEESIERLLQDYYDNGLSYICEGFQMEMDELIGSEFCGNSKMIHSLNFEIGDSDDRELIVDLCYKGAFIKVVSRPFFTFHLRKRQAAFSFVLQKLNELLEKREEYLSDNASGMQKLIFFRLLCVMFKAMVDLNANYIIRSPKDGFAPFKILLELAKQGSEFICEKGDEDGDNNGSLFSLSTFIHGIKKMMTLTQDSTKTLLLEANLIYGNEENFFNEDDLEIENEFLEENHSISKVAFLGLLYLENNRILHYLIEGLKNERGFRKNQAKTYFLENFFEMCKLNGIGEGDLDLNNSLPKYNELKREFKEYDKTKEYTIDDLIEKWIKSFINKEEIKNWNIICFLRDPSKNAFLNFYLLRDSEEGENRKLSKWFYNMKTLSLLSQGFKECEDDVFFMKGGVDYSGVSDTKNGFLVVKFTDGLLKKGSHKEFNKEKSPESDETIYLIIRNFDPNNQVNWFALKAIMILRGKFIKLIRRINLPIVISEKRENFYKEALRIDKSLSHDNTIKKTNLTFNYRKNTFGLQANLENLENCVDEKEIKHALDPKNKIISKIYFQHLHLITDNEIAAWYRKALQINENYRFKFESVDIYPKKVVKKDFKELKYNSVTMRYDVTTHSFSEEDRDCFRDNRDNFYDYIKNIFLLKDDNTFEYYFTKGRSNSDSRIRDKLIVKFIIKNGEKVLKWEDCQDYRIEFLTVDSSYDLHNSLVYLIVLFINNIDKHSPPDIEDVKMEIIIDLGEKKMIMRNKFYYPHKERTSEEILSYYNRELESQCNIFPHLKDGNGITLWTLKNLTVIDENTGEKCDDWISFGYEEIDKEIYFQVILNNIKKRGEKR